MKTSRKIMRIEVSERARAGVDEVTARFGVTQLSAISRCIQSFVEMPEMVQASILGICPPRSQHEISVAILEQMAKQSKK